MKSSFKQPQQPKQEEKVKLWKMKHMDTGRVVDVHPDERVNYFKGGYRPYDPDEK